MLVLLIGLSIIYTFTFTGSAKSRAAIAAAELPAKLGQSRIPLL